ncbi:MAG: hypothetical protein QXE63_01030 [Zestosphaera sp.]
MNAHHVACLNLFSRLNDNEITIGSGRINSPLEAGLVVPVYVALNEPATGELILRKKPIAIVFIRNT